MCCKSLLIISLLLIFSYGPSLYANSNLWSIDVVGGGAPEHTDSDFYQGMIDLHSAVQSFDIPADHQKVYFGPTEGPACYITQTPEEKGHIQDLVSKFNKHPEDCVPVSEILYSEIGYFGSKKAQQMICDRAPADIVKKIGDVDNNGKNIINGASNKDNILQALTDALEAHTSSEPGHLLLTLSDHGLKDKGDYVIALGDRDVVLSDKEMKSWIQIFKKAGFVVHLNVDACYSGGFNALTSLSKAVGDGGVCVTTTGDSEHATSGPNDPIKYIYAHEFPNNLKKYHNQIQAHACSMAEDSWNKPQSSLDITVDAWTAHAPKAPASCHASFDVAGLKKQVSSLASLTNMSDPLRTGLLDSYQKYFIQTFNDCVKFRKDDQMLAANMGMCLAAGKVNIDPSLSKVFQDIFSQQNGAQANLEEMEKTMRFLKEADAKSLKKYQQSFCCLAYDLKTGQTPSVCKL